MQVTWPNGNTADFGATNYGICDVNSQPTITWDCKNDTYYTFVCSDVDPLGVDKPYLSEVQYWSRGNINGCNFDDSESIFDFLKPTQIWNSDFHRVYFVIFEHDAPIVYDEPAVDSA